jgi:hypothetical protein
MGRMNFDHLQAEAQDVFHIGQHVRGVPRMQAAAREQSLRIFLHIVGNELVHTGSNQSPREPHN